MTGAVAYAGRGAGAGTRPVRYLRDLYFFRCGFSALWVALVFAGISFAGWTESSSAGLTALAQYSAGGAVWYLLTALWLWLRGRLTPGAAAGERAAR